jgi:hypothetical protein
MDGDPPRDAHGHDALRIPFAASAKPERALEARAAGAAGVV